MDAARDAWETDVRNTQISHFHMQASPAQSPVCQSVTSLQHENLLHPLHMVPTRALQPSSKRRPPSSGARHDLNGRRCAGLT